MKNNTIVWFFIFFLCTLLIQSKTNPAETIKQEIRDSSYKIPAISYMVMYEINIPAYSTSKDFTGIITQLNYMLNIKL